jgi:hypothetical protein
MATKGTQPSNTNKEYGRRNYVESKPTDHFQEMQRITHKAEDDRSATAHSEPIKPYMWDDYPESEYWFSPWNMNFTWGNIETPDFPTQTIYTQNPGETTGFTHCSIFVVGPLHCDSSIKAKVSLLVLGPTQWFVNILQGDADGITTIDHGTIGSFWDFEVLPPPGGWVSFPDPNRHIVQICFKDGAGAICCETINMICFEREEPIHPPEDCCATYSGTLSLDDDATPDTIVKGSNITVTISGGCPPYNWSTSSLGYTLNDSSTVGLSNVLNSATGTCGVHFAPNAEITVTDHCGQTINFTIRNTSGVWANTKFIIAARLVGGNPCGATADFGVCHFILTCSAWGPFPYTIIKDNKRWDWNGPNADCGYSNGTYTWCDTGTALPVPANDIPPGVTFSSLYVPSAGCGDPAVCACWRAVFTVYIWQC